MATKMQAVPASPPPNRIWLELETPRDAAHAKQVAALATSMMRRLDPDNTNVFQWNGQHRCWLWGNPTGALSLKDGGLCLNLDYLGRDIGTKE